MKRLMLTLILLSLLIQGCGTICYPCLRWQAWQVANSL